MRKIILLMSVLLVCVTSAVYAQEGPIVGLTGSVPTERFALTDGTTGGLTTGYYLIKNTNGSDSKPTGYLKPNSASAGQNVAVTSTAPTVDVDGQATYIWYVEVNQEAGTFTIATANKEAYWQNPDRWGKPLVVPASKGNFKLTIVNQTDGNNTSALTEGACLIYSGADATPTNFFHFTGDVLGSWNDCNPNSLFYIEFYKIPEEKLLKKVTVTYNYTYNGKSVNRSEKFYLFPGEDFPEPTRVSKGYVTAQIPEGTVAGESKEYDVALTLAENVPFEYSATYGDNLKWYYLRLRDANTEWNRYIQCGFPDDHTDRYSVTEDFAQEDKYQWAFIGNPVEGFTMVNKATGEKRLYIAGETPANGTYPMMSDADATTWLIDKSNRDGYDGRFGIKVSTASKYLNNFRGENNLSLWEQGPTDDEGSNVRVVPVIEPGFYRLLSGTDNNRRMTSTEENSRMKMETGGSNAAPTVFYMDAEHHLVAFSNGLCVGKYASEGESSSWKCVLSTDENVGSVKFYGSATLGQYNIQMSDGRYLYHADAANVVNCGGSDADEGYRWIIEKAEYLPVPISAAAGYGTLVSPVPLNRFDGTTERVRAYTGRIEGKYIVLTEIEGNVIPAGTPVVLQLKEGIKTEDGCIYLPVVAYNTVSDVQNSGCLTGKYLAETTTGAAGNCTLQIVDDKIGFYTYAGSSDDEVLNLYGFKAYISGAQAQGARGFAFRPADDVTGISGVISGTAGDETLYDLNGRRVLYPASGIYVTASGKKILVK